MNILMIALFAVRSCGPTEVIKKIVPELIENGNRVDVFSPYEYDREKDELARSLGMNYYYSDNKTFSSKSLVNIIPDIYSYDIVHFHGIYEYKNWLIAKAIQKMSIPYVYTIHGNLMQKALEKSKYKKQLAILLSIRSVLNKAKCIHALSNNEANDIKRISNNRILCIPNGIDRVYSEKATTINNNNLFTFLFVGRIDINHKGIDILNDAIKSLPKNIKERCRFIIAGPFETSNDEEYVSKELDSCIRYIGPVYGENKIHLIEQCSFFIHTSRYEGMPMAVLEALSYGIPCIVTKETNMADIIEMASAGIVTECSSDSVSRAIEKVVENDYQISVNTDWLQKNLTWKDIGRQYEKMYF